MLDAVRPFRAWSRSLCACKCEAAAAGAPLSAGGRRATREARRGEARRGDGSKERCLSAGREACAMRWQAGHRRANRVLVLVLAEAEAAARGKRKVSTCVRDDRVGEQRRRAGRRGNQGPRR